jgi:exodeoxyribonuclease-5
MSFAASQQQAAAIRAATDWYRQRRRKQQVFRLFGFAGTGKSTITRHVIEALGLTLKERNCCGVGGVLFAAFTGKAASVMTRKGTPASTIHSLIYRVSESTPAEIQRVEEELAGLRTQLGRMGPKAQAATELRIRRLVQRVARAYEPTFLLNSQSLVRDAELIVLDEVSMVGRRIADDLLSFGKPVLVLGDPGQLGPISGSSAFTGAEPDVVLTEVHRQAGDSAILRLATMARQCRSIPHGEHDPLVCKLRRAAVDAEYLLGCGQVICGRNGTRLLLNGAMRRAAGFPAPYPIGEGEKIICLRNRHDLGLVNGTFVELRHVRDEGPLAFSASIMTEDGQEISGRLHLYKGHYDDHLAFDPDRARRDWRQKRGQVETVWGYAITCHKAQGSQWENVIVYDDGLGRTAEDRARWLYTAITRAERRLVILD